MSSATHSDLCALAVRWLRNTGRCTFAVREPTINVQGVSETPDAFGFDCYGRTVLIECKASRSDFLADRRKWFRRVPSLGLGCLRYYLAPRGVIARDDLPPRWGLIIAHGDGCRRSIKAADQLAWAEQSERRYLMALLARLELRAPRLQPDGRLPPWVSSVDTEVSRA